MLIQLIIIQAVTFVGLLFVLRMLFYRQLGSAVTRLKRLHEENVSKEDALRKELEAIRLERQEELKKAREEADGIIKAARAKSEKVSAGIESEAKKQAEELSEKTKLAAQRMGHDLAVKYKEKSIELSMRALKALFSEQGQEAFQHQLISELIGEIKNLKEDSFTSKSKEARVSSALPLAAAEKEKLAHALSAKTGCAVDIKESRDEGLIAGLVIQMGSVTIDGSLRNKLEKIIPHLKEVS